ncbi:four helix bundle protein [Okeania sp. SIO2C9]|uniref:four helix bundle protein n=1 Tax=Okeania sp. SIO2C9 TaxID=2607791 RepID=UPI0025F8967F|nr:four helix bundle protein [Okeania sp. SIO2C9]
MRRASVSVPANIAEGFRKKGYEEEGVRRQESGVRMKGGRRSQMGEENLLFDS